MKEIYLHFTIRASIEEFVTPVTVARGWSWGGEGVRGGVCRRRNGGALRSMESRPRLAKLLEDLETCWSPLSKHWLVRLYMDRWLFRLISPMLSLNRRSPIEGVCPILCRSISNYLESFSCILLKNPCSFEVVNIWRSRIDVRSWCCGPQIIQMGCLIESDYLETWEGSFHRTEKRSQPISLRWRFLVEPYQILWLTIMAISRQQFFNFSASLADSSFISLSIYFCHSDDLSSSFKIIFSP